MCAVIAESNIYDLLQRSHNGDLNARDLVLGYVAQRMHSRAQRMLHGNQLQRWEEPDDLIQLMLVRLGRRLATRQVDSVDSLLRVAARELRFALIDLARHYFGRFGAGTHSAHTSEFPGEQIAGKILEMVDPGGMPSERLEELEARRFLDEAVEGLPVAEREIVVLIAFHGFTQAEAATFLGVSEKTVGRRWHNARRRLYVRLRVRAPRL